ncbi:hypothetical protein [Candidatus Neptunichlamydia sp. REUL1]|uniref:hypothetical protein n=1 Tax=Candidatus Neptunichlamydia sp. REUL1 TaxID=3064277 RepID=UPI00292E4F73|nr:hypothetical protein [Candidatus Neptunochlamydia sp. REUL1]
MLDMLGKVGQELHEIYKTGSALVAQGCNHLLDTPVGKKVSEVTSPVFIWVKDHTPESVKNKSFVYGAGAVVAIRIPLRWLSNTPNNHLEQAAKHYDHNNTEKAHRIRSEKV